MAAWHFPRPRFPLGSPFDPIRLTCGSRDCLPTREFLPVAKLNLPVSGFATRHHAVVFPLLGAKKKTSRAETEPRARRVVDAATSRELPCRDASERARPLRFARARVTTRLPSRAPPRPFFKPKLPAPLPPFPSCAYDPLRHARREAPRGARGSPAKGHATCRAAQARARGSERGDEGEAGRHRRGSPRGFQKPQEGASSCPPHTATRGPTLTSSFPRPPTAPTQDLVGRSRESWDLPLALDLLRVPRGEFRCDAFERAPLVAFPRSRAKLTPPPSTLRDPQARLPREFQGRQRRGRRLNHPRRLQDLLRVLPRHGSRPPSRGAVFLERGAKFFPPGVANFFSRVFLIRR